MRTHAVSLCSRVPEFLPLLDMLDREPPSAINDRCLPQEPLLSRYKACHHLQVPPSLGVSSLTPRLSGGWGETHMWAKEQHCHPTSSWVLTYNRKHQAGASVTVFSRHRCRASWQGASRHCQSARPTEWRPPGTKSGECRAPVLGFSLRIPLHFSSPTTGAGGPSVSLAGGISQEKVLRPFLYDFWVSRPS